VDDDEVASSAERTAAVVAPHLDRIRLGLLGRARPRLGELAAANGLDLNAAQTIGMLRNLMPDRSVPRAAVLRVFCYQPVDVVLAGIDGCVAVGVLDESADGWLSLSEAGRGLVHEIIDSFAADVGLLWEPHQQRVDEVLPLVERVADAATDSGGAAFSVMAPVWRTPEMSPALLLAELLTPLRFHRFDAHIEAWTAAGLTIEQMQALPPGDERNGIERETDRLAAVPYRVLPATDRAALVHGLEALPA
jgi:hypothetical protein